MLVYSAKLKGTQTQYRIIDEILRTGLFVGNKVGAGLAVNLVFKQTNPSTKPASTGYWLDNPGVNGYDIDKYCQVLADKNDFFWVRKLNSIARQAMAERGWIAISKFWDNCQKKVPEKKDIDNLNDCQLEPQLNIKIAGGKSQEIEGILLSTSSSGLVISR